MLMDSESELAKQEAIRAFSSDLIRIYYGRDLVGSEIGAAAKNVIGIAARMLDGLGLAALKGALMSRGTREIARLIVAMGGEAASAYGLCHLGDYEATLFSAHSQNRAFGEAFVRRQSYAKLAEGHATVNALRNLGKSHGVELPICQTVTGFSTKALIRAGAWTSSLHACSGMNSERGKGNMKAISTQELKTPRLRLRVPQVSDASALVAAGSLLMSEEEARARLSEMASEATKPFGFHWVIELDGVAVGRIKGWEVSPFNGFVQLGYDIAPSLRSHGLMTEAVGAVVRYLLIEAEANRVYCSVREGNMASRRVCEKNGFRHEGVMRQHYARQDGGYDDVYIYGLIRSDLEEK